MELSELRGDGGARRVELAELRHGRRPVRLERRREFLRRRPHLDLLRLQVSHLGCLRHRAGRRLVGGDAAALRFVRTDGYLGKGIVPANES